MIILLEFVANLWHRPKNTPTGSRAPIAERQRAFFRGNVLPCKARKIDPLHKSIKVLLYQPGWWQLKHFNIFKAIDPGGNDPI